MGRKRETGRRRRGRMGSIGSLQSMRTLYGYSGATCSCSSSGRQYGYKARRVNNNKWMSASILSSRCDRNVLMTCHGWSTNNIKRRRVVFKVKAINSEQKASQTSSQTSLFSEGAVCNDFVCISSPNVERTIKQIAKDIEGVREGFVNVYADCVEYRDTFMSWKGREPYVAFKFHNDEMELFSDAGEMNKGKELQMKVVSIEMTGTDSVSIEYLMRGQLKGISVGVPIGAAFVEVKYVAEYQFNLISGRVIKHNLRRDLNKCTLSSAILFTLTRLQYSLDKRVQFLSKALNAFLEQSEGNDTTFTGDPRDPNKVIFILSENVIKHLFKLNKVTRGGLFVFNIISYSSINKRTQALMMQSNFVFF